VADFSSISQRSGDVQSALSVIQNIRAIYQNGKQIQAVKDLYQGGSSPGLKATVDAVYTPAQFAELGAMINQILPIIADWEANHASAIGGP
jgi:hypothetical protein